MNLDFDFDSVKTIEFGVGMDDENTADYCLVPVDPQIQGILKQMATDTWSEIKSIKMPPDKYSPADKHAATDALYLPINNQMAHDIKNLQLANNLSVRVQALSSLDKIFCYFVRLTDQKGRRLTAVRRATHFKGVIKKRLISIVDDSMVLNTKPMFALDSDFDFLVDSKNIFIYRPSGFEFAGKLQDAIIAAVPTNIVVLKKAIPFVDFQNIELYANTRPRAARYLASIKSQGHESNIDRTLLEVLCKNTGVDFKVTNGQLVVSDSSAMGLLEVLDRRRYEIQLTGQPEKYLASNRHPI